MNKKKYISDEKLAAILERSMKETEKRNVIFCMCESTDSETDDESFSSVSATDDTNDSCDDSCQELRCCEASIAPDVRYENMPYSITSSCCNDSNYAESDEVYNINDMNEDTLEVIDVSRKALALFPEEEGNKSFLKNLYRRNVKRNKKRRQ